MWARVYCPWLTVISLSSALCLCTCWKRRSQLEDGDTASLRLALVLGKLGRIFGGFGVLYGLQVPALHRYSTSCGVAGILRVEVALLLCPGMSLVSCLEMAPLHRCHQPDVLAHPITRLCKNRGPLHCITVPHRLPILDMGISMEQSTLFKSPDSIRSRESGYRCSNVAAASNLKIDLLAHPGEDKIRNFVLILAFLQEAFG